jgi:FkbM family methyltransferase
MRPNKYLPDKLKNLIPSVVKEFYWDIILLAEDYRDYRKSQVSEEKIIRYLNKLDDELDVPQITFLDIGSRYGTHLNIPLQRSNIELEYIGIEPDDEECNKLSQENPNSKFYSIALGKREKKKKLNITQHQGCSSILEPNNAFIENFPWISDWFEIDAEKEIKTTRLGEICSQENFSPDLIKSDTQGYEYEIFKGSGEVLESALLLEFEAHFKKMYKQQKLFGDIDVFLRSKDFELIDLTEINRWNESRNLNLYRNKAEPFNSEIVEVDPLYRKKVNLSEKQEKKLYALLINYGKLDYAKRVARNSENGLSKEVERIFHK